MINLDDTLLELINQTWSSPFLDRFMPALSALGIWKPFMIVGAIWALVWGGRQGHLFILSVIFGLVLGDVIISNALKHLVGRPRPREVRADVMVRNLAPGKPTLFHLLKPSVVRLSGQPKVPLRRGSSFPSSHVVNIFMVAAVAFRFRRGAGVLLCFLGFMVAWSRIYCGAHWPSDIPPAIFIGLLSGWASFWLANTVIQRIEQRGW